MKAPSFKKPTFKRPSFGGKLAHEKPAPDPLKAVQPSDDIETGCLDELSAVQKGFRERAAQEAQRFQDATDTGYYSCVVFENRAQLDAWLEAIGMLNKGDLYLDGRELARHMGIQLPPGGGGGKPAKLDPKLSALVRK